MKSNELRIANWIEFEGKHFQVTSIDDDTPNGWYGRMRGNRTEYNLSNFKPIPLTEEWLLKFGFEPHGGIHFRTIRYSAYIAIGNDGSCGLYNSLSHFNRGSSYNQLIDVEYVHQLQNLYFALTGEELTIQ